MIERERVGEKSSAEKEGERMDSDYGIPRELSDLQKLASDFFLCSIII